MRRLVSLVSSWALLVLLWVAFVGTTDLTEVVAGYGAAAIAAVALEVVRSQRLLNFRFERATFFRGASVAPQIVYDFGVLTWELARALARRHRIEGKYVEVEFPAGESGRAQHAWRRAYATTAGTVSPNAIVVAIDPDENIAHLHALWPDLRTGHRVL